jgi:LysR family transcriptional regulator for bpeEF and oprC
VRDHLASGALVEVLADTPPPPMPISLLYPQGRMSSPRLRAFADWLAALLRRDPDLQSNCKRIVTLALLAAAQI